MGQVIALAQRFSLQQQAMGVVDQPVQNGIGNGRITNHLVPVVDRDLAGDDGRAALTTMT